MTPKPAVKELRFRVQLQKPLTSNVSLLDINCKILLRETFTSQSFTGAMHIEYLYVGAYYLQVCTNEGVISRLFIKMYGKWTKNLIKQRISKSAFRHCGVEDEPWLPTIQ